MHVQNEVGTSVATGRRKLSAKEVVEDLSRVLRRPLPALPEDAVVYGGPEACPACGSQDVVWGCDDYQELPSDAIHPVAFDEHALMADSFLCRACDAGWIQPDEPAPITWVRPYWRVGSTAG